MNDDPKRLEENLLNMAAETKAKLRRWAKQIWDIEIDDDFTASDDYKAAELFYQQFVIEEKVCYKEVVAYAQKLHDSYEKQDRNLDDKADAVVKYLGGGSAIITFGALLSLKTDTWQNCLLGVVALVSLLPSLNFAVQALRSAIKVRHPRLAATMNPINFAVAIAGFHKETEKVSIKLWLQLHAVCESYHYRNLQKQKHVADAYVSYFRALCCLGIPLAAVLLTLIGMGIANFAKTANGASPTVSPAVPPTAATPPITAPTATSPTHR